MTTETAQPLAPRTMSLVDAGKILGIGQGKTYELAKNGQFPVRVLRLGKKLRVSISQLDAYLQGDLESAQNAGASESA